SERAELAGQRQISDFDGGDPGLLNAIGRQIQARQYTGGQRFMDAALALGEGHSADRTFVLAVASDYGRMHRAEPFDVSRHGFVGRGRPRQTVDDVLDPGPVTDDQPDRDEDE